jgi:hypothetical protein
MTRVSNCIHSNGDILEAKSKPASNGKLDSHQDQHRTLSLDQGIDSWQHVCQRFAGSSNKREAAESDSIFPWWADHALQTDQAALVHRPLAILQSSGAATAHQRRVIRMATVSSKQNKQEQLLPSVTLSVYRKCFSLLRWALAGLGRLVSVLSSPQPLQIGNAKWSIRQASSTKMFDQCLRFQALQCSQWSWVARSMAVMRMCDRKSKQRTFAASAMDAHHDLPLDLGSMADASQSNPSYRPSPLHVSEHTRMATKPWCAWWLNVPLAIPVRFSIALAAPM